MKPSILFLSLATAGMLLSRAQAGTVILPAPVTDSGPSPVSPAVVISSSVRTGVDLESGRVGLTPGDPILVRVRGDGNPVWAGSFLHGQGELIFVLTATLSLSLDGMTKSASAQFGDTLPGQEGSGPYPVSGYQLSPVPLEFSLTIPWEGASGKTE